MDVAPTKFQLNTSRLFLTYPQCRLTKERTLELLKQMLPVVHYIVAFERHANGDPHLHCYLELSGAYRTRSATALDLLDNGDRYHGNYQGCRSCKNVVQYCTKAEDFISDLDVAALCGRRSTRAAIADELVVKKRKLEDVLNDYPTLVYDYSKLAANIKMIVSDLQEPESLPDFLPNPWGLLLSSKVQGKQRHYWIYSREPNVGKTFHFGKPLASKPGRVLATSFTYWDVSRTTNCIVLDDYNTAGLGWHSVNQLADNTYQFRIFMGGYVQPSQYLVIFLSNQTISELYPHAHKFISARFIEICVDKN